MKWGGPVGRSPYSGGNCCWVCETRLLSEVKEAMLGDAFVFRRKHLGDRRTSQARGGGVGGRGSCAEALGRAGAAWGLREPQATRLLRP